MFILSVVDEFNANIKKIAVTLYEWEHAAEPFEKATHYTEKALFKILTLDIIPVITAELRVRTMLNKSQWQSLIDVTGNRTEEALGRGSGTQEAIISHSHKGERERRSRIGR